MGNIKGNWNRLSLAAFDNFLSEDQVAQIQHWVWDKTRPQYGEYPPVQNYRGISILGLDELKIVATTDPVEFSTYITLNQNLESEEIILATYGFVIIGDAVPGSLVIENQIIKSIEPTWSESTTQVVLIQQLYLNKENWRLLIYKSKGGRSR